MIEKLQQVNEARQELEAVLVDLLSGFLSITVALIPAYFIYHHLQEVVGVPWQWSAVIAVVMVLLEFSILNKYFELRQYRVKYAERTTKGSVDPKVLLNTFKFYLVVILLVNGVLAFFDSLPTDGQTLAQAMLELITNIDNTAYWISRLIPAIVITLVIFLLSLLSIPGAIVVATGYQQKLHTDAKKAPRSPSTKVAPKPVKTAPAGAKSESKPKMKANHVKFLRYLATNRKGLNDMTKLADAIGVSRQTAYNYKKELEGKYFRVNSAGIVVFMEDANV
jgi:hypothetical protein